MQFGELFETHIQQDPLYQRARGYSASRGTLLPEHKLANLFLIVRYGLSSLSGDVFEFGTFRGGSAVFMASLLRDLGRATKLYAFDTFQGMPKTDKDRDLHNEGDFRDADLPGLKTFIAANGLDKHLIPVIGKFEETLPAFLERSARMSLVHVDCDIYDPIKYLLPACNPHVEKGGYVVFDDPLFGSCIGAFDAMAEEFIRRQALLPEQVYPHLVFRPNGLPEQSQ